VLRKLSIAAALAGIAALPAGATRGASSQIVAQSLLMPGVSYQRQVEFTPRGPVVLDVVIAPRPDGSLYTLAPSLSNNAVVGTETLTGIEKDVTASTTAVGVNGDFFAANPGGPTGILVRGGVLDSAPISSRSSLGIAPDGTLTVTRVAFDGIWHGSGQRRQLDLNAPPVAGHTTLYTPAWGPATPAETGVVEDVIGSLPPTGPSQIVTGAVTQVVQQGGTPIPPAGAVLVARGAQAQYLTAEAPAGSNVDIRLTLTPNWSGMAGAIGGGPLLVSGGKAVFRANEAFDPAQLNTRSARTAVGQLADGRILLVNVEGGSSAYSVGMTNYELATALTRLGAVTAMGLGSGPSAGIAFDGTLLSRPSAGAEQPVSDALLLSYNGVYAAPPATDVLSPNGDGVDDTQTFTYKLVRASQVTATLSGPGGVSVPLAQDAEQPGVHTLQWAGPGAEGNWQFTVTATDDQGRTTSAERDFSVNDTLGSLSVSSAAVTFQLTHPAKVTVNLENGNGIVVATLLLKKLAAGPQRVTWTGRPRSGLRVRVIATNSIGTASLVTPFTARRH